MVTSFNQLDFNNTYSYADYLLWKFQERVELYKGKIFKMSPVLSTSHQRISGNLHGMLWNAFRKSSCNLFAAPFDVRLIDKLKSTIDSDIYTVVQPDLCVICDQSKIDTKGAVGAPDLIIEILSGGNSKKEMKHKYELYQESGVLEYWIVNPFDKTIYIFKLVDNQFIGLQPLTEDDIIKSTLFPQLNFCLSDIFN